MILTYKIKHGRDFLDELEKAFQVAQFVLTTGCKSTKEVKQFGLKAVIACQIIRKYGRNKKLKAVHSVNLTVPNQGIKLDTEKQSIEITALKLNLNYQFPNTFEKINQIELDNTYAYVAVTVPEKIQKESHGYVGVDRNTTGHIAVACDPRTGKVYKLGKKASYLHKKYQSIRKHMQQAGQFKRLETIKTRESDITKNINHHISRKIVDIAAETGRGIKLEDLTGIRNGKKQAKSFRYALNSWSFYQIQTMIEYKAKILGVEVVYVDPAYTSQQCSKCGQIGDRNKKSFKCPKCGHESHADVNAGFNIAMRPAIETLARRQ